MSSNNEVISSSRKAKRTFNPIRNIVESLNPPKNHPKKFLNLALGDPTAHGLAPPKVLLDAMHHALDSCQSNGYFPAAGEQKARASIATYSSRDGFPVHEDDVVIASGCSGALELVIGAMIDEGDNILVPCPGFPLYQVITESLGGKVKHYPLLPLHNWECDIEEMENLIDTKTKAILVNNPSNPCGANYTAAHLASIAKIAAKHSLPIISDEIYSGIVFEGVFTPMNTVCGDVPVISVGGLAKEFVCPGWRVGWLVVHDRKGRLAEVRTGIKQLTQLIVGASSLVQACIPRVLTPAQGSADEKSLADYARDYTQLLHANSQASVAMGQACHGLEVIPAQGAMYAMVRIQLDNLTGITSDTDFAKQLLQEENLIVLPGSCFGVTGFIRIITCPTQENIKEALNRMQSFCDRRRAVSPSPKKRREN